ncbi:MAG: hypothetical protein GY810_28295 [Aureispira sp.]|nr:hypothetical protein [Aureispira sp.]
MKRLMILYLMLSLASNSYAQFDVAIGFETELQVYEWQQRPKPQASPYRSVGQVFSFPSIGPKIWFGDWNFLTVSLDGKVAFSPFSLDLVKYKGMGSLSFPTLLKVNFDPTGSDGSLKLGVGGGVQWTMTELYARPKGYRTKNIFFMSYIGEVSIQIVAGDEFSGGAVELFIRGGGAPQGAITFSLGIKYNHRVHFSGMFY